MQTIKFKPGDKVLISDKNYGCRFIEVRSKIEQWQGECGIGWILSPVYNNFYVVGYTKDDKAGDFYTESDLKHFIDCLEDELFEI